MPSWNPLPVASQPLVNPRFVVISRATSLRKRAASGTRKAIHLFRKKAAPNRATAPIGVKFGGGGINRSNATRKPMAIRTGIRGCIWHLLSDMVARKTRKPRAGKKAEQDGRS